jgi:hypothetical protein
MATLILPQPGGPVEKTASDPESSLPPRRPVQARATAQDVGAPGDPQGLGP